MGDPIWIDNIKILYKEDRLFEIWPGWRTKTFNERYNALTRFCILYFSTIAYYKKSLAPLLFLCLSLIILLLVFKAKYKKTKDEVVYFNDEIPNSTVVKSLVSNCKPITQENPFGNPMLGDTYDDRPTCSNEHEEKKKEEAFENGLPLNDWDVYQKGNSQRQFYTMPVTKTMNDQTDFAKWLYT
jgi:hypothetical protein